MSRKATPIEVTLAKFDDPNTGENYAFLGGASEIWVPSKVTIGPSSYSENPNGQYVLYDLPDIWGRPPIPDLPRSVLSSLKDAGWRKRSGTDALGDFKGLLEEFTRLIDGSANKVRRFVLKWGPLWWCTEHHDCCWQPELPLQWVREDAEHRWVPAEAIEDFQAEAKRVKAALDIVDRLREEKPGASKDWEIFWPGDTGAGERNFRLDRLWWMNKVNRNLSMWRGASLWLEWSKKDRTPKLTINTGLGFFPVVWLQVAQFVTGAKGLYVCDGCGKLYIRLKRRPPKGRNHFCDECGKKDRGAKKLYARKKANEHQ